MNFLKNCWIKHFYLHHMNECDELNFYYKRFLNKLSKLCLKIYTPLLIILYLCALLICRLFLTNQMFDIRIICYMILIFVTFILLILIRLHTKRKKVWIFTRLLIIILLILPLLITHQTEQYHILLSTISIILIYSFLTFTLIQSLLISLSISMLHIVLLLNQKSYGLKYKSFEFVSIIIYHLIVNLFGLYSYVHSIKTIRQHFYTYKNNLLEKNQYNVDCKKLHTIIGYCQQSPSNAKNNSTAKNGTVINCSILLNEQTRIRTCDELASLIDVLYCQIEQIIIKNQPQAHYIFDNETIIITIFNEDDDEQTTIDQSCRLAIELFRFIEHVNTLTQWNLKLIIGIDYNQVNLYFSQYIHGLAYDCSRFLREEYHINNRIHVSFKIYDTLKMNSFYQFSLLSNNSNYLLFNSYMYEPFDNVSMTANTSDMIDQLTRIQTEYYVEKRLGTITLTRTLRKRSLFKLTSKYMNWFSLNFKEGYLSKDFQMIHRTNRPTKFIYLFVVFILIGSLFQSFVLNYINVYYLSFFSLIIIGLLSLIILFHYSIGYEKSDINKTFFVYLNILICLTLATLFFVAVQYNSIQNFKYLINSNETMNRTFVNLTFVKINTIRSKLTFMCYQYHEYLILSPIYPIYFSTLFRQCSWMIKTIFIIICSIFQLFLFEYVWAYFNRSFLTINILHHYTTFTLIILHNILLILLSYRNEWLEKIDFIWLKQIDNERLLTIRQRNQLVKQTSFLLPLRVVNYYLNTNHNSSFIQHYHLKYNRMGLLYINFHYQKCQNEYCLIDFINNIEYLLKTNEKYINIVMHKKSTIKELMFSIDTNQSYESMQQLVELLLYLNERLKTFPQISISCCLHIGYIDEIFLHLKKYPKIDIWSEHISFIQLLVSKIQWNHCLVTSPVYQVLNDLYLFRTAGSIINTPMNIENNTNIYFLLGRLIEDNIFQGRNALPLTISYQTINYTHRKSSSTDGSQCSQSQYKTDYQNDKNPSITTTTTTSSNGILNDQQSLLKQSSGKYLRKSNSTNNNDQMSYRHSLLQALNPTTNNFNEISPVKRFAKTMHPNDSKCFILTQQMLSGSTDDKYRSNSTPPTIRSLICEQKSQEKIHPSHSLSATNEETMSVFSGWDEAPTTTTLINSEQQQQQQQQTSSTNLIDRDLSFTVNMTTSDNRTTISNVEGKRQIAHSRPVKFNLARQLIAETSESEMSIQQEPWTQNIVYQSKNLQETRLSSSHNNLSKLHAKNAESPQAYYPDLLHRWLTDQINQFRFEFEQETSTPLKMRNDSTDDESEIFDERIYPIIHTAPNRPRNRHFRYRPLRKTAHLIRHESLKNQNRPLLLGKRTNSSSMPRSDRSDISSRPENLSQSVLSNHESEYDNMYAQSLSPHRTRTNNNNTQLIINNDSEDETTLINTTSRCYI